MSHTITSKVESITPAIAKKLLLSNTHNRTVGIKVRAYSLAMMRGEWKLNGEAIKIAADGAILDGQHRLLAIIESGVTIQTLVVRGLTNDTQETMDTGKSRSLADVLKLRGEKNCIALASIITGIIRWELYGAKAAITDGTSKFPVTNAQATARLDAEPSLRDLPMAIQAVSRRAHISSKIIGVLYYQFTKLDVDDADFFIARLTDGDALAVGNPILTLKRTLNDLHDNQKGTRNSVYTGALTIQAWNKFRRGEDAKILRWIQGGANPQKFPLPE